MDGPSADTWGMTAVPTHYRCTACSTLWTFDSATSECPRCLGTSATAVVERTERHVCAPCNVLWVPKGAPHAPSTCWCCGGAPTRVDRTAGAWEYTDPAAAHTHTRLLSA